MTSRSSAGSRIFSLSNSSRSKFSIESSHYPCSTLSLESKKFCFTSPSHTTLDSQSYNNVGKFSPLANETVTVKFSTTHDESFTKTFRKHETVTDVKNELSRLFCIPVQNVSIEHIDNNVPLHDDHILTDLHGVESTGIAELKLKITGPYKLPNRDLIYGHLPNVDVITVRLARTNLIVEIENRCENKPWLGGYRNKLTKKLYHHASCQTEPTKQWHSKTSKLVQTVKFRDESVNTMCTKGVQTQSMPSNDDRIIIAHTYIPAGRSFDSSVEEPRLIVPDDRYTKNDRTSVEECFQTMYQRIHRWNWIENRKINRLEDESERRTKRLSVLDHTRKYLSRVNEEKRRFFERIACERQKQKLSQMATPKQFVATTGERILLETVRNQRAKELYNLYTKYCDDTTNQNKIKAIFNLTTFFEHCDDFGFIEPMVELLQRELVLRTNGSLGDADIASLQQRTERYILHYVTQLSSDKTKEQPRIESRTDIEQYRVILRKLQDDETMLFKCLTSMVFRMRIDEIRYLVRDIWDGKSIKSECESIDTLRMTRWRTDMEWSPWNCILLTKSEVKKHLTIRHPENEYDKYFVSRVQNKHLLAKVTFNENSSLNKIF